MAMMDPLGHAPHYVSSAGKGFHLGFYLSG